MRTPTPELTHTPSGRVAHGLAEILVASPWREDDLVDRAARALGRRGRWLRPLIRRALVAFDGARPTSWRLAAFLANDAGYRRADAELRVVLDYSRPLTPAMWPAPGAPAGWPVPAITSPRELADRLKLTLGELDAFADLQGRGRRAPAGPLRHYVYAWRPKPSGSARLIEAPKARLKALQRQLLDELLAGIPPHDAAHGFRAGRSIKTFAEPHAGRPVVLRIDLRDFFPSVSAARVVALFLTAGYPEPVARRLAGLCTSRVPLDVWQAPGAPGQGPDAWRARRLYQSPHLPQGAPTSPALANLVVYRLDARLTGLAASAGAFYTRYADDLVFSGDADLGRAWRRFAVSVGATALDEGFAVNPRKTRLMRQGVRQRVAGVVVNAHPNVPRDDYDRLKATLHNCARSGPSGQNRDAHHDFRAHLTGRVAHVAMLNPGKGAKLRALLEAVAW